MEISGYSMYPRVSSQAKDATTHLKGLVFPSFCARCHQGAKARPGTVQAPRFGTPVLAPNGALPLARIATPGRKLSRAAASALQSLLPPRLHGGRQALRTGQRLKPG